MRTQAAILGTLLLLVSASGAWAKTPPQIAIDGPDQVAAGELAILLVKTPNDQSVGWAIIPMTKNFYVDSSRRGAVLCGDGTVPEYNILVGGMIDGQFCLVQHRVVVSGPPEPSPPLPDPDVPEPLPKLAELVKQWTEETVEGSGRVVEANALAAVYDAVVAQMVAGTLKTPEEIIRTTMERSREAVPRYVAWQQWGEKLRAQLNSNCEAGLLKTVDDHVRTWRAISLGLKAVK